jgi:hypothetical protein
MMRAVSSSRSIAACCCACLRADHAISDCWKASPARAMSASQSERPVVRGEVAVEDVGGRLVAVDGDGHRGERAHVRREGELEAWVDLRQVGAEDGLLREDRLAEHRARDVRRLVGDVRRPLRPREDAARIPGADADDEGGGRVEVGRDEQVAQRLEPLVRLVHPEHAAGERHQGRQVRRGDLRRVDVAQRAHPARGGRAVERVLEGGRARLDLGQAAHVEAQAVVADADAVSRPEDPLAHPLVVDARAVRAP